MVKQGGGAIVNVGSIGGLRHLGHGHRDPGRWRPDGAQRLTQSPPQRSWGD